MHTYPPTHPPIPLKTKEYITTHSSLHSSPLRPEPFDTCHTTPLICALPPPPTGEYFVPCPAAGVVVIIGFAAPIASVARPPGVTVSRENAATFLGETLESTTSSAEFSVVLDTTTTGVATDTTKIVTYVSYSDNEGNYRDLSGLVTPLASAHECDWYATPSIVADVSRKLHDDDEGHEHDGGDYGDCDICSDLSSAQLEALAMYDNGGKKVVCDPTCLDGVSDPIHCNCEW